ncbi:MAG: hypothetical protein JWQ11_3324 [Rhizobacter sp.]|nr:hypothetical protein [Rhizobacter sp.]
MADDPKPPPGSGRGVFGSVKLRIALAVVFAVAVGLAEYFKR